MTRTHLEPTPGGLTRWIWASGAAVVCILALWEAFGLDDSPDAPPSVATLSEREDPEGETRFVYGFTPVDLGLLADAARRLDAPTIVAGYPGTDRPAGPVLSKSPEPEKLLPNDDARKGTETMELENGWTRLLFQDQGRPVGRPTLARAHVWTLERKSGDRRPCPRFGLRSFACDGPEWAHVDIRNIEIGGAKKPCMWTHPLEGRTTVIDFGPIGRDGERVAFTIRAGLNDVVATSGGPVDLVARLGDRTLEFQHRPTKGWQRHELPVIEKPHRLRLEISAEKVGQRHFCFELEER